MNMKKKYLTQSLISLFAALATVFLSGTAAQQKKPEVPYVPTPEKVVEEMLKMAQVGKNDVLYDLGCGDGRIVITATKKYGCRGVGIDIDPVRIKESRENAVKAKVSNRVKFIQMDLFEADISDATVVTLYLLSKVNLRLRPKLFQELSPGTRIVSHNFNMGEWKPDATSTVEAGNHWDIHIADYWDEQITDYWDEHLVHFWIIPGNVTGTWTLTILDIPGKNEITLKLDQEFQHVWGKALEGRSSIPLFIKDEKIKGDLLQFTLERKHEGRKRRMHFEGRIQGNTLQGTLKIEGSREKNPIRWKATRNVATLRSIIDSDSSDTEPFKIRLPLM